jgi:hypothetical protein
MLPFLNTYFLGTASKSFQLGWEQMRPLRRIDNPARIKKLSLKEWMSITEIARNISLFSMA